PACQDLPNNLRTRTYPATVTAAPFASLPANTWFYAMLSGASLDSYFHNLHSRVNGDRVTFDLSDNGIKEEVAPETYYSSVELARRPRRRERRRLLGRSAAWWTTAC